MKTRKQANTMFDLLDIQKEAADRVRKARADVEKAFPTIDAGTGQPTGKFIRIRDNLNMYHDGTADVDYSVKVDWVECSVGDFIKIAEILKKHFPEEIDP